MKIEKCNSEGYADPTAYEAMTKIAKEEKAKNSAFRPLVYICSPYSGDIETNVEAAKRYSRLAVDKGYIPLTPHLLFPQFLDDDIPEERELGLFFGNVLMDKCREMWVCGDRMSSGMEAEIARARRKSMIIRAVSADCKEVTSYA